MKVSIDQIIISKDNPRQSFNEEGLRRLGESIKTHGQLQPIIVRRKGSFFELVVGERRLRASALVGLTEIEANVREIDNSTAMELRLIENTQREDLTDAEKGDAVLTLWANYEKYETLRDVAEAIKVSYKTVRFVWVAKSEKLSQKVKMFVHNGSLTDEQSRLLLKYSHSTQEKLAKAMIDNKITTGTVELRSFLKLHDENPDADLSELANKAKGIETVTVPKSELPKAVLEKLEEKKQLAKVKRIRKKPSKPLTKKDVREKLQKKTDFKFVKAKVTQGKAGSVPMLKAEIKPTIVPIPSGPDYSLCKCAVCPFFGSHCKGRCWQ